MTLGLTTQQSSWLWRYPIHHTCAHCCHLSPVAVNCRECHAGRVRQASVRYHLLQMTSVIWQTLLDLGTVATAGDGARHRIMFSGSQQFKTRRYEVPMADTICGHIVPTISRLRSSIEISSSWHMTVWPLNLIVVKNAGSKFESLLVAYSSAFCHGFKLPTYINKVHKQSFVANCLFGRDGGRFKSQGQKIGDFASAIGYEQWLNCSTTEFDWTDLWPRSFRSHSGRTVLAVRRQLCP